MNAARKRKPHTTESEYIDDWLPACSACVIPLHHVPNALWQRSLLNVVYRSHDVPL